MGDSAERVARPIDGDSHLHEPFIRESCLFNFAFLRAKPFIYPNPIKMPIPSIKVFLLLTAKSIQVEQDGEGAEEEAKTTTGRECAQLSAASEWREINRLCEPDASSPKRCRHIESRLAKPSRALIPVCRPGTKVESRT